MSQTTTTVTTTTCDNCGLIIDTKGKWLEVSVSRYGVWEMVPEDGKPMRHAVDLCSTCYGSIHALFPLLGKVEGLTRMTSPSAS